MFIQNYSCKTTFVSTYNNCKLTKNHYISSQKYNLFFLPFCSKLEHYLPLKAGDRTRHICHPPSGHRAVCCLYGQIQRRGGSYKICSHNINLLADTPIPCQGLGSDMNSDRGAWQVDSGTIFLNTELGSVPAA